MPKISVIIPVYNAEAYISRAVKSVLTQTLGDVEVIAVNDGSTDQSRAILEQMAQTDERLKTISIPNGGVSNARQIGIENATGEYVIHCDADDFMEPNILEQLYNAAVEEQADIVICDYLKDNPTKIVYMSQRPSGLDPLQLQRQLFRTLHGSVWNKLIKASLLRTSVAPKFTPNITCKEDWLLLQQLLDRGNIKTVYIPVAGYHYVTNPESITMSSRDRVKNLTNDINIITELEKLHAIDDPSFAREVTSCKLRVKFDMILSRAYTRSQIIDTYPEVNSKSAVLRCTLPFKIRIVLILFMLKILPI